MKISFFLSLFYGFWCDRMDSRHISSYSSSPHIDVSWDSGSFLDLFGDHSWNSSEFFLSCLKENRTDDEINPLEDAIISRMYLIEYKTSREMSEYLNRSERAINLRLRMLYDVLPIRKKINTHDKYQVVKFFRKRCEKYLDFCRRWIIACNPEHEIALLDDGDDLLREALEVFLDVPEENCFL